MNADINNEDDRSKEEPGSQLSVKNQNNAGNNSLVENEKSFTINNPEPLLNVNETR